MQYGDGFWNYNCGINKMKKYNFLIIAFLIIAVLSLIYSINSFFNSSTSLYTLKEFPPIPLGPAPLTSSLVNLPDAPFDLTISPATKIIFGKNVSFWTYNGQLPGPILKVQRGSNHTIVVHNTMPFDTTVHWHGIRLDNKFDGMPGVTQNSIQPNNSFAYQLNFPDVGVFWYHPHVREDYQLESGLYGMIQVVDKNSPNYFPVVLDDISLDANGLEPFYQNVITHALMGRYGNKYLINGEETYSLIVNNSEPIYLAFLNVANARPFRIIIPGAKLTLVEGDMGPVEHPSVVDSVILSPAERAVVRVDFPSSGIYVMYNDNPMQRTILGTIVVKTPTQSNHTERQNPELRKLADNYQSHSPDYTLDLGLELNDMSINNMHGMGMMHIGEGTEWEDTMPGMAGFTSEDIHWTITDKDSQKKNMDIHYQWPVGSYQKIRIVNSVESPHPMQHPIHFHGQRFLILARNGVPTENLMWKDTVSVGMGDSVDILLEASNPGMWMAHCHIEEHLNDGMMFIFEVK